jgi:quercetin dioxygenase-like cupin family protein
MDKKSLKIFQEFNDEKFTKRIVFKEGESTVFLLNFMPGHKLPPHKHPGTEVYILVIIGNGTFTIDDVSTEVSQEDVIHCSGEENLSFDNTGDEPVTLYVMLNKIPNDNYAKNI